MRHEIKLVCPCYIGDATVRTTVEYSRTGARVLAALDATKFGASSGNEMADLIDMQFVEAEELTWDQIEGYKWGDADDCVRHAAMRAEGKVVKAALYLKPAGMNYCDGSD